MNKIISKRRLSENVFRMDIEAPLVAEERKAGQFIIIMVDGDMGERVPLTIADADASRGTITIIFQTVGATTMKLSKLEPGSSVAAVLGPLGRPTEIRGENGEKPGRVVCVGGGIGVAARKRWWMQYGNSVFSAGATTGRPVTARRMNSSSPPGTGSARS